MAPAGRRRRKNVLLVSFDDAVAYWRYKTAFGEPLRTPNLDRLCARATAFHAAYCQVPICAPSRASFMTGRTPHELGLFDRNADVFDAVAPQEIWSCRLKEAGYFCSSGGKVHHKYKPLRRPQQRVIYSDGRKHFEDDMHMAPGVAKKKFGGHRGGWGTTDPKDDATYYDHQSAQSAIDFIQTYDGEAPFYREVGFYSPHGPHYTPARFKEIYDVAGFRQPEAWADGFDDHAFTTLHMPENPKLGDRGWWAQSVRNYFSSFSHGDFHLGRVLDALWASPHAEDTMIVILSDHGFHLGNRNRYRKATLWEQVASVPLIIHDPEHPTAREVHDPVALIDVGPTVLDFVGLPPIERCVGRSLRPQVGGASVPDRTVPTLRYANASIRKGGYRLIRYSDGSTQFFDLAEDYWQMHDLGRNHPDFDDVYRALVVCCRDYGLELPALDRAGQS